MIIAGATCLLKNYVLKEKILMMKYLVKVKLFSNKMDQFTFQFMRNYLKN